MQPEVRYWFGQVDGLFTGVHIRVASYNYALKNSTYRYQNSDTGTPLLNMGLTAGYRLSLGKGGCWCLEFSLGAGYAYLDYDRFFNIPGGAYVDTRHKNFSASTMRVFQWATVLIGKEAGDETTVCGCL